MSQSKRVGGRRGVGARAKGFLKIQKRSVVLKRAVAALPQAFICIDALDECWLKHQREGYPSGVTEDADASHTEA